MHLFASSKQKLTCMLYNGMLCYSAHIAAFHAFAGGRYAPSLSHLHVMETNQDITTQSCTTPESCRYILKNRINLDL